MNNLVKAPCKGCTARQLYCHSKCQKYIDYKTEHDKHQTIIKRLDEEQQAYRDYKEAKVKRLEKSR